MSSGPLLALLLARQDAVDTWREMLGPADVQVARSEAPESLRAQFANDEVNFEEEVDGEKHIKLINLIHGSSTLDEVERDMGFFFPVERTLAAIKPDAYANRDEIIERIKAAGFHVAARKDTQLTEELAKQLYSDNQDKPFYEDLVHSMTSGRTLFMVLTRQDAVAGWRGLMGPTDPDKAAEETLDRTDPNTMNIRATYGRSVLLNAVHGSSSVEHANKTIELIFGDANIGLPGHDESEQDRLLDSDIRVVLEAEEAQATAEGTENELDKPLEAEEGEDGAETSLQPEAGTEEAAAVEDAGAPAETEASPEPADQPAETTEEAPDEQSPEAVETQPTEEPEPEIEPEPEPEPEPMVEAPGETPAPEEAPAEEQPVADVPDAAAENQNQSANSEVRTYSRFSSSNSSASIRNIKSRSGDTTPKPKSARSIGSTDADKVISYNSVDTVSCQCNPYFRTSKRRKSTTDKSLTRKRVNVDVDPAEHKQHRFISLIRKRPFSTQ
ncbi:Thioredoxin domain-containing protein 3 [Fasciola gigantica]|uniref:Thioredoxin domain-containing protein 3 n=1 Tax=Fasciola gigantica TaxID=46835 RepID=A0A504YKE7_FASGI|nr:Thioredoxin domain-containing protein 3 [Fasciola gigantica]